MKDYEKRQLADMVKWEISVGRSMTDTVKRLSKVGFKQHTIRAYYKAFSENKKGS